MQNEENGIYNVNKNVIASIICQAWHQVVGAKRCIKHDSSLQIIHILMGYTNIHTPVTTIKLTNIIIMVLCIHIKCSGLARK